VRPRPFDAVREARPAEVWETLARWRAAGRRFALASVVESRGFTPRKPGAHMLIAEDGEMCGTIGGGTIEQRVIEEARALLLGGGVTLVRKHLTQELGMCCGGEMGVFLEVLEPAPRLYLFGAGYIARPLAALAAGCGFEVTVVDERAEWALSERFPDCRVHARAPVDFLRDLVTTPDDYAVVVTHDHGLDQRIVQALLERPLRFVGMIGSVPKQRKFALRLRARGFSDAQIARLRTPLGMPIGADTPEEIAVSAMGEIIAVRRGAAVSTGWTPPVPKAVAAPTPPGVETRTDDDPVAPPAEAPGPGVETVDRP
jgi:xanthine dehydrogenase accessory factor